jgi:pimeloyl-ACP methyl ester carboxylesterase
LPDAVGAIVSRSGRLDLAADVLPSVKQPTLLIVGGNDPVVIELNRRALALLGGRAQLEIVPRASHLFGEPGTLQVAADLARDWFVDHLKPGEQQPSPL